MTEILARATPSLPRRLIGASILGTLGTLLVLLAFFRPPSTMSLQLFLIGFGLLALVLCARLYRATAQGLVLTSRDLTDTSGRVVAQLNDVARVERGIFAFKPSNGFLLRLKTKQPRAWAPGLWWRLGRRVGVGGLISGAEGRQMADIISAMIAEQSATDVS
jgi:hypothetical protein